MRILVYGLPGSGKTYFSKQFKNIMDNVIHINADEVRTEANDWDFSEEGRKRQLNRMIEKAEYWEKQGFIALCDFVCPTNSYRRAFNADYEVWVNTIEQSKYEDTNKIFEVPYVEPNYIVTEHREDVDASIVAKEILHNYIKFTDMIPDEYIPFFLRKYLGVKPHSLLEGIIIAMTFPLFVALGVWWAIRDFE